MNHEVHPAAALFPMLSKPALKELQHDMEVHGMLEPVKMWNGMIIDGRNRMEAIKGTLVRPKFQDMEFKDEQAVIAYIVSTNIQRRHLTTAQRTAIAAELANLNHGGDRKSSEIKMPIGILNDKTKTADAAKQMQVAPRSVARARAVLKASPDLHAKVKAGELSVNAAHNQIAPPKPKQAPVVVPDPDFADMDDPPPFIPPAKTKHFIGPADCEDPDAWQETQPKQTSPTAAAQKLLQQALDLSDFDRGWLASELSRR